MRHQNDPLSLVNPVSTRVVCRRILAYDVRHSACDGNGTLQAASELGACLVFQSLAEAKRNVIAAVAKVAERLNNTAAVCRKCYIHPSVIEAYLAGGLPSIQSTAVKSTKNLSGSEKAILSFLRQSQVTSPGS